MNSEQFNRIVTRLESDLEDLKGRVGDLEKVRLYSGDCYHTQINKKPQNGNKKPR